MNARDRGYAAENHVVALLEQEGCVILSKNYAWRGGEIDIIAQKHNVISFIEVKMRTRNYLAISEIIPAEKRRRIITTAQKYISEHSKDCVIYRFDVAFLEPSETQDYHITYIPNAFTAPECV